MLDVLRRMGRHYLHKCLKTLEVIDSTGSFHEWQADTFFLRLNGMGTGMVGADVSSTWEAQPPPSKQLLFTDCWRRDQKTCSQSKMQRAHTVREGEPRFTKETVGGVNCFGPVEFTRTFVLQKAELEKVEMGGADVDSLAKRVEQLERRVGSRWSAGWWKMSLKKVMLVIVMIMTVEVLEKRESKMIIGMSGNVEWVALSCKVLVQTRPQRLSIFQSDGLINVFFQATIGNHGFPMVLLPLDHHHWMFYLNVQTLVWIYICLAYKYGWHRCERFFVDIGVNGFSMVFKILKAMVRMSQCT